MKYKVHICTTEQDADLEIDLEESEFEAVSKFSKQIDELEDLDISIDFESTTKDTEPREK